MEQYISKSALIAEIENKIEKYTNVAKSQMLNVMAMVCIGAVCYPALMRYGRYVIPSK